MLRSKSSRNVLGVLSVLALALGVGCGGTADDEPCEGDSCADVPGDGSCTVAGVVYADGAGVPSLDGCNSCGCIDGQVACTTIDCADDSCNYEGAMYAHGTSIMASDGCNTCTCSDGEMACTERACLPDGPSCSFRGELLAPGEARPAGDGCNTCTCLDAAMECTAAYCVPSCGDVASCDDGMYCAFPQGYCGLNGGGGFAAPEADPAPGGMAAPIPTGQCQARAEVCTQEYAPVCGCDGVTYSNACAASGAGINVAYGGECQ